MPVKHEGHGLGLVLSAGRAQHRALVVDLVDVDNVLGLLLDFSDVQRPARYFVSIDKNISINIVFQVPKGAVKNDSDRYIYNISLEPYLFACTIECCDRVQLMFSIVNNTDLTRY